jgi:type IV pilus assembly protein PilW
MKPVHRALRNRQHGFGLVEILVGVTIGIVGILVMFQTLSAWDTRSRTTNAGGDAQVTGALAMFSLERDIKQAGMGIGWARQASLGCTVSANQSGRAFTFKMVPVEIFPGANGAPDTLRVLYGNSSYYTRSRTFTTSTAFTKKTAQRDGFNAGDLVIVSSVDDLATSSPALTTCALVEITATNNADLLTVDHQQASYTNYYTAANVPSAFNTAVGTQALFAAGTLYNLGPSPRLNVWTVPDGGGMLSMTDLIHGTTALAVSDDVINLKAQYGVDSNGDNRITELAPDPNEWTNAAPADWTKLRAIRVALLVRSKQYEAEAVTPNAPAWAGGAFTMSDLTGPNAAVNDWRHYRYRVYEKVIPLRNMIWGNSLW